MSIVNPGWNKVWIRFRGIWEFNLTGPNEPDWRVSAFNDPGPAGRAAIEALIRDHAYLWFSQGAAFEIIEVQSS